MDTYLVVYRIISFILYLLGVVYITILMPSLRQALGDVNFLLVLAGFLLGLSKAAEYLAHRVLEFTNSRRNAREGRQNAGKDGQD